jgi:hypothetical protein
MRRSILSIAAADGNMDLVMLLLERGADAAVADLVHSLPSSFLVFDYVALFVAVVNMHVLMF